MDRRRKTESGRGAAILFLVVLLLAIAGLTVWALSESPPSTPNPSSTAIPETMPNAAPPPQ